MWAPLTYDILFRWTRTTQDATNPWLSWSCMLIVWNQEIIKVRECILYISPLTKVIPLTLFLDIVLSSSADITCALRGCFRDHFVTFHSKIKENFQRCGTSCWIFWLQARELRLSACFNTFRNFNRSLNKKRMSPAQIITTEWTAE